jgi:hypothetical protein
MTADEWVGSRDYREMSDCVVGDAHSRKWRLLACHLIRGRISSCTSPVCHRALRVAEDFADGKEPISALQAALESIYSAIQTLPDWDLTEHSFLGALAIACDHELDSRTPLLIRNWCLSVDDAERSIPHLLRDLFGNPFRPVAFVTRLCTSDVMSLARAIYDDNAFERLPILADALMDAGCEDEQVIGHCRGPGPHVRGCWVVDLVLGKN